MERGQTCFQATAGFEEVTDKHHFFRALPEEQFFEK